MLPSTALVFVLPRTNNPLLFVLLPFVSFSPAGPPRFFQQVARMEPPWRAQSGGCHGKPGLRPEGFIRATATVLVSIVRGVVFLTLLLPN